MAKTSLESLFSIKGLTVAITGGGGILCSEMAKAFGDLGCKVAVLDLIPEAAERAAKAIRDNGGEAVAVGCDVLKRDSVMAAADKVVSAFGKVDVLVNGAGGNKKDATTSPEMSFFDLPDSAFRWVFELNCVGTILPSQVFGKKMAERKAGQIINVSSMSAFRPLTKVSAYSAAKAAISNFTQWLAVHMAQEYSPTIRVNAIAPGFFLTEQNRFLLTEKDTGKLTARGQKVIDHTPAGKFGKPFDLVGGLVWLMSPSAEFVTGVVVPIDGGFAAYSGV
ncbi:MAG: SDR family oxidoreductase [Phycisphaerae bacterium]|nr:SDR family oxidoreductase [Phycisphaerae bacterium]